MQINLYLESVVLVKLLVLCDERDDIPAEFSVNRSPFVEMETLRSLDSSTGGAVSSTATGFTRGSAVSLAYCAG